MWQKDEEIYSLLLWNSGCSQLTLNRLKGEKLSRSGNDRDNVEKFLNMSIFYVGELFCFVFFNDIFLWVVTSIFTPFKKLIAPIT